MARHGTAWHSAHARHGAAQYGSCGTHTRAPRMHTRAARTHGMHDTQPALKAPGFCFARQLGLHKLGDASSFSKLQIVYEAVF